MKYKLKNEKVTVDEINLFREAVKDIKTLHPSKPSIDESYQSLPFALSDSYPQIFHTDEPVSHLAEKAHLSPAILRKIQQGLYPIDAIIDLHGNMLESACHALSIRIQEAYDQQQRCLLVIHGKGRSAQLKNYTIHWLKQMPCVFYFCSAQTKDGGTGALYVLIKKKKVLIEDNTNSINDTKHSDINSINQLNNVRKKIDVIDQSIIKLLCQRLDYAKQAAELKKTVRPDNAREQRVLDGVRQLTKQLGYPSKYIEAIFTKMMEEMRRYQADRSKGVKS